MASYFQMGRFRLPLQAGPATQAQVMGVLNITPDSFSDGGAFLPLEAAIDHAEQMLAQGVDIIDIGGESSRPGALPLALADELQRVMPVLFALRDCGKPLSVDTTKPQVMREALLAGADMINDINAFRAEGAIEAVLDSDCGLCIMHMQNRPATMQQQPDYDDVVSEVIAFLQQRVAALLAAGVARNRLCVDPGFGFGKTLAHNLALLHHLPRIGNELDLPLLVGLSRKSMIGSITCRGGVASEPDQRLAGSLAAALFALAHGAQIVRVHDVAETVDAIKVWQAAMKG